MFTYCSVVVTGIVFLAIGWFTARTQVQRETLDLRRVLLDEMSHNRTLQEECVTNLQNQFTPGFKCAQVLYDPSNITYSMKPGKIFKSSTKTQLAINGSGFFQVKYGDKTCYTRDGRFLFQDGVLVAENGGVLLAYKFDKHTLAKVLQPIELPLSRDTKLYAGRYYDFNFTQDGL